MKKITIYLFASFFMMSLVSSAVAKITLSSEFKYKTFPDEGTVQSCEDQGYLTNKPLNSKCDTYKGCFINCECLDGYVKVNGVCTLNDCSAYPKTSCSVSRTTPYKTVEFCPADSSKCIYTECQNGYTLNDGDCVCTGTGTKISDNSCVCDSSVGYEGTPPNCTATACTGDYSATVTSCDTGYTLNCDGYSAEKRCCKCTCTANTACTESAYPYTAANKPSSGSFESCDPGCGGAIRYRYKACPSSATTVTDCGLEKGWILVDAGITLANGTVCKQCSCSFLMLGKIECPASSKCELMCNKTYQVVSTCADEGYEYSTEETVTLTTGETSRVLHCLVGQTEEYCPYDETLYKCTGEVTIPEKPDKIEVDSCVIGYFLASDTETACACPYGIYNDGTTKSTVNNNPCYRCGTYAECGGSLTKCIMINNTVKDSSKCHTGVSETASSCSGGAPGSVCACGGIHDDLYTPAHACALQ